MGLFDPREADPFADIGWKHVGTVSHQQLALEGARQSIVLLQNGNGSSAVLPLNKSQKVLVAGPMFNATEALLGNYHGAACHNATDHCLLSLENALKLHVSSTKALAGVPAGCKKDTTGIAEVLKAAAQVDVVVLALGGICHEREGIDRDFLHLPGSQMDLFRALYVTGKPLAVVIINGGPFAIDVLKAAKEIAIVQAGFPGQAGAQALVEVLVGDVNPSGKLTTTVYPASYANAKPMKGTPWMESSVRPREGSEGRSYMFYTGVPLFPFGYGLSYTIFKMQWEEEPVPLRWSYEELESRDFDGDFRIRVTNTGPIAGREVVQAYWSPPEEVDNQLMNQLFAFQAVSLDPGESSCLNFSIKDALKSLSTVTDESLLIFPASQTETRLKDFLLSGKGSWETRLKTIRKLRKEVPRSRSWIERWRMGFPEEILEAPLELSPLFSSSSRGGENPLTTLLNQKATDPSHPSYLAKLIQIKNLVEAEELLAFLKSQPCQADFPPVDRLLIRNFLKHPSLREPNGMPQDPMLWALSSSRPHFPKEDIFAALQANPSFQELPPEGKAKYYLSAHLNSCLLEELPKINWHTDRHRLLAQQAKIQLSPSYLSSAQRLEKALWLTATLSSATPENLPYRLERWAADIELLNLDSAELQAVITKASATLSESFQQIPEPIFESYLAPLKSNPSLVAAMAQLRPELITKSRSEAKDSLVREHMIGGLLLSAATLPGILRADQDEFLGMWSRRTVSSLHNRAGALDGLYNRFLNIKGITTIERIGSDQWKDIGPNPWLEFHDNLKSHLKPPPGSPASTFVAEWLFARLKLGRKVTDMSESLKAWTGGLDHELAMRQAWAKKWNEENEEELSKLLAKYPPAYFRAEPGFKKKPSQRASLLAHKRWQILEDSKAKPTGTDDAEARWQQEQRQKKNREEQEIVDWLTLQIESGQSFLSLATAFKTYHEYSGARDLESLIQKLGTQLEKSAPDRNWKKEAMAFLESIDPGIFLETHNSKPPLSTELALDSGLAERYFQWAKQAGVPAVRSWGRFIVDAIPLDDPAIAYHWINFALTQDHRSIADGPPFTSSGKFLPGYSSSDDSIWTELAKAGRLTSTAKLLEGRLHEDVRHEIRVILALSLDSPEWTDFLPKTDPSKVSNLLSRLEFILKHHSNSKEILFKVQRYLLNKPDLYGRVDLDLLLMSLHQKERSETIRMLWRKFKLNDRLVSSFHGLPHKLLAASLTEADDETFAAIMSDLKGHPEFQWLSVWDDLLENAPLTKPQRVNLLLQELERDEIYNRLCGGDQRGFNWWNFVASITTAAYHGGNHSLIKRLQTDLEPHQEYLKEDTHYFSQEDRFAHLIWAGKESQNTLVLDLARKEQSLQLLWSLVGNISIIRKVSREAVHPSVINSLDGRYDLSFYLTLPDQAPVLLKTFQKAQTQGAIDIAWNPAWANGSIEAKAIRIADRKELHSQKAIPSVNLTAIEIPKTPGFSQAPFKGPFGKNPAWLGSYLGTDSHGYPVEIAQWDYQAHQQFHLAFWLWKGSVRKLEPSLNFYDLKGKLLGTKNLEVHKTMDSHTTTSRPSTPRTVLSLHKRSRCIGHSPLQLHSRRDQSFRRT